MSRYKDQLFANQAYAEGAQAPILNLDVEGPQSYLYDLAYYPGFTDYINKNLIIKVLRPPQGLLLMPQAEKYIRAYKNILETYMQSWSGFNRTLSVGKAETALGNASEVVETNTRVTRARSQITSTIVEKDRRPVIRFLEFMVRYLVGDPEVGHPLLSGVTDRFQDQLLDMIGGTILAYEPDKTMRYVENAFLITNFWIHGDVGENTSNMQKQQDGETRTYNLSWTGIQKVGASVDRLAQSFMDAARVTGIDPSFQTPHIARVDSEIAAVATGYTESINRVKRTIAR